jgi:membrane associated rhomboid family serine protease
VQYLPGFNRILASGVAADPALAGNVVPRWTRADVVLRALGLVGGGTGVVVSSSRGIVAHSMGPFFVDFAHQPYPLSYFQKHRYLTSGFLHGSLIHLGMNLRALLSLPTWLENGIGKGVYLSAYLVAVVTGNIAHTLSTLGELPGRSSSSLCVGASGGICGLYGLMFASLWKMANSGAAIRVFRQMLWLVAFGWLVPNLSNAAHVGGFVGGCLVGYLFGPGYSRSYSLMRRADTTLDYAEPEFRSVMGPGK